MQYPWNNPASPMQLLIPLDSTRLRGMSPLDRQQAVTRLAILLMEVAKAADEEQRDDEQ